MPVALKIPLVLKPGSAEPWSPARIAQAYVRAGCPPEAFGYYPCDYAGATEILRLCGRGMIFGDTSTTARWAGDPRVDLPASGLADVDALKPTYTPVPLAPGSLILFDGGDFGELDGHRSS